jgi:thiosulfate dehydrogenase [quinone] large subunit
MANWTLALADNHPVPAFGSLIWSVVEPNRTWFPYLVLFGEAAVGIGLIFGFLTPIWLLVGIFLNINYLALAGVKPKDRSVNAAYQCEQGQNLMMIASQFILFVLAAGSTWSLDQILSLFLV